MGLRINHNRASETALKNLRLSDRTQAGSLERLSTGLRINRGSDDPSGLVVSERLRAQISSLKQAQQNANHASNLLLTAENAVGQIQELGIAIRESIVFALNSGGNTPETIQAEQDAVDRAIEAIDRIAETTRFGDVNLLNGTRGFNVLSGASTEFTHIQPFSVRFDRTQSATSFDFRLSAIPSQATFVGLTSTATLFAAVVNQMTLRVTGKGGTEELQMRSGATWGELRDSVNVLRGNTGVYMSGAAGVLNFYSEEYGADGLIRIERVDANSPGALLTADLDANTFLRNQGGVTQDFGVNGRATINGETMRNDDLEFSVANEFFDGNIHIDPTTMAAGSTYTFRVLNDTGFRFQLNINAGPSDDEIFGLESLRASYLGTEAFARGGITEGGYLTSLHMGRENDLLTNPTNALRIIDQVLDQISDLRAFTGAFDKWNVQQSIDQLGTHIENLTASESDIRDLDFAQETANFTRAQILFQAGTAVMAQANLIPQSMLQLLQ